jgi:hypothetical protein
VLLPNVGVTCMSQDSRESKMIGWIYSRGRKFSLRSHVQTDLEFHQPPIRRDSGALPPEVKWLKCEAHYSPQSSTKIKNISLHSMAFKYRRIFSLLYLKGLLRFS